MRWITITIMVLVFTLLNASNLFNYVAIGQLSIKPDLLITTLAFFALTLPVRDAVICSFLIGFMADISSPGMTMGPAVVCYGIFGWAFCMLRDFIEVRRVPYQIICVLILAITCWPFLEILNYYKIHESLTRPFFSIPAKAFYSAAVAPIVWKILSAFGPFYGVTNKRKRR